MPRRLTPEQRDAIAADAAARYAAGETWQQIAARHDITSAHARRLTTARHDITFRPWGNRPALDPADVARRRDAGATLDEIATALGCSRQAVRTALEASRGRPTTRYPRLSARRLPTPAELQHLTDLYTACPAAPRNRPGARNVRGPEGRTLAEACLALIDDGIPMQTLSRSLGRGATWVHWLLGCHDLRPTPRASRSTSTSTRAPR